jgi:hypothetical protein
LGAVTAAFVQRKGRINNTGDTIDLIISLEVIPTIKLYGTIPDAEGVFYLESLSFLSSGKRGWNEFTMQIAGGGVGTFFRNGEQAALSIQAPVEMAQISGGKILRNNIRITGDRALTALHNRREQISAPAEWMKERPNVPVFTDQNGFEDYWLPLLLPEIVKKKLRPPEWWKEGAVWTRAGDVRWNTTYTQSLFPEDLRVLRDSGALLQDWEEAAAWIFLEYQWEYITDTLSMGLQLWQEK